MNPIDPAGICAVLLLVQHHFYLVVAAHALVIECLVITLREAFYNQLLALFVSAYLVLVCSFVVADHLTDLRNDFPTVSLVALSAVVVWGSLFLHTLGAHDITDSVVLVDLHYLCLLLECSVGS